jgi:mono/diheme cytochrome c family protein
VALGLVALWLLSAPRPLTAADIPQHTGDVANGERLYHAAGCFSCHQPSPDLKNVDASLPAGGAPLTTPVGTLYPLNLTPDPETGIGNWTDLQFLNAVMRGISPEGEHLIPALPYTSYAHMKPEDVLDIRAYLASLPAVTSPEREAEIPAAPLLRRGIGLWKWVGLDTTPWTPDTSQSDSWNRGSYLVNGPGHCQECHTPRNAFMALDTSQAFAGGPHPEGKGRVPSLRGMIERGRYTDAADLASALQYGGALGYDKLASGGMGQVQRNISMLPESDIQAIADYIASLK